MGETMAVEAYGEEALRADAEACYELAAARAYLYTLFHKVLGGEPTTELLAAIGSEATAQAVGELAREDDTLASFAAFAGGVGDRAEDAAFVEEAQEEFARFFEGPAEPPAYPWEGPYLTRETMVFQPNTLAVRAAYADYGLQVRRLKHIPDDHVSIMAAFMADLSERASWWASSQICRSRSSMRCARSCSSMAFSWARRWPGSTRSAQGAYPRLPTTPSQSRPQRLTMRPRSCMVCDFAAWRTMSS